MVCQKRIHFGDRGRQTDQIKAEPAEERDLVALRRRLKPFSLQPDEDERVNQLLIDFVGKNA